MKVRNIALSLAGAGALLLAGTTAASAANSPPNPPSAGFPSGSVTAEYPGYSSNPAPFLSNGGIAPDSINPGGEWVFAWSPNDSFLWVNGSPYYHLTSGQNWTTLSVFGGSWSLIQDNNTKLCMTWDGGPNTIYEKPCDSSKPSEQWASSETGANTDVWYFWNRYLKETAPNDCGNSYAPVITDNSSSGNLLLECPENGPTTYSINQQWEGGTNGPL